MRLSWLIFLMFIITSCNQKPLQKITFGSCSHEYDDDQMWPEIIAENSDLFIWSGDIIYGDTHNMDSLATKYQLQKNRVGYQNLIRQTSVIGIWDDHDYGANDGGKNYSMKKESKEVLLDFLDVPQDNSVRTHEGMYNSYQYGPIGNRVNIILLDCRYFRDTLYADAVSSARYLKNPEGDILGKEQWNWLEDQLTNNQNNLNIIVSGIQILANEHGFEKWGNFPKSRDRLINLIQRSKPAPTILLSGDRHIAELSKLDVEDLDYPIFDFTSSGLTHTWGSRWEEPNELRMGNLIIEKNYGVLEIEWNNKKPSITFLVKGKNGAEFLRHSFQF